METSLWYHTVGRNASTCFLKFETRIFSANSQCDTNVCFVKLQNLQWNILVGGALIRLECEIVEIINNVMTNITSSVEL